MNPRLLRRLSAPCILALAAGALLSAPCARAADTFTTLHSFNSDSDGDAPYAALTEGADGNLYGVNTIGGRSGNGTIFRISAKGTDFTVLNTFTQSNQGNTPEGGIVQASNGNFYGTTSVGGGNGFGTLFQVVPSTGKLSILATFASGSPGADPVGALIQGLDGFLYGTAEYGGGDNDGTVFRADIATGVTATFSAIEGGSGGINPESDLIQASDGNFYGTTSQGGADGLGTVFQITPAGVQTTVYSFKGNTDGGMPLRGVVQGADGALYGIANAGGTGASGVIFRLTVSGTTGTLTPVYAFQPSEGDGTDALGGLIQASDGNFYGTTSQGGSNGDGTVFSVTPDGGFTTLYNFSDSGDSGDPISGLIQGSNGMLYGTTAGESDSNGTIYSLDLGLASPFPQVTLFTTSASVGNTIVLQGKYLVGTTAVHFTGANGTQVAAASFNVPSGQYLTAVVPAGAATGAISVTANGRTGTTAAELTITGSAPNPPPGTTINVIASDPVAAFLGNNDGRFKLTRTSANISQPLTVLFEVAPASTGVRGTDYYLSTQGETLATVTRSITIPAHELSVGIKVVPLPSAATSRPDRTVILRIRAGSGYKLGGTIRAKVSIAGYTGE